MLISEKGPKIVVSTLIEYLSYLINQRSESLELSV